MPYNPTTGIITAPVSIHDVQQALNVASGDLGTLCKSYFINIWAKYKPVNNTRLHYMGQWDALNNKWKTPGTPGFTPADEWWRGFVANWKFGLSPFTVNTLSALVLKYDQCYSQGDDMNGWVYHGPTGGENSPFRLTDFACYNHKAQGLAEEFVVNNPLVVDSNSFATFIATIMYSLDDETNITPENLLGSGSWYFGVALVDSGGVVRFAMTARYEHTNNIETLINLSGIAENATYKCYPFFSINPVTSISASNTFYTIPMLHPVETVVKNRTTQFKINVRAEYGASGTDRAVVVIKIEVDANANYTDCYIDLDNGGSFISLPLTWSGNNATATANRYGKLETSNFNLVQGSTYYITISGLDVNSNYIGTLYAPHAMYERRFGIAEVIQE